MRKYGVLMLVIALVVSFGYNVHQQLAFNRLYWYWGSTFTDRLINGHIRIDQLIAESDVTKRSASVYGIQEAPQEIMTLGSNLNLMLSRVSPYTDTYLAQVGMDIDMFSVGVWIRSSANRAVSGSSTNQVPSLDDMARLSRVYKIYAAHFTDQVVMSHNADRHKTALKAAHDQIRAERLDELLPQWIHDKVMNANLR